MNLFHKKSSQNEKQAYKKKKLKKCIRKVSNRKKEKA